MMELHNWIMELLLNNWFIKLHKYGAYNINIGHIR